MLNLRAGFAAVAWRLRWKCDLSKACCVLSAGLNRLVQTALVGSLICDSVSPLLLLQRRRDQWLTARKKFFLRQNGPGAIARAVVAILGRRVDSHVFAVVFDAAELILYPENRDAQQPPL